MKNIFLLPYGGGSAASFRAYVARYPRSSGRVIPVDMPGRGRRSQETAASSIQECAALALRHIDTGSERYILHGHCMGALLAFEAIKLIQEHGRPQPRFLVVSGRNAPRYVNEWLRKVAAWNDRDLFEALRELGGVPPRLSFAMAQQFLAAIRHDQAMFIDYEPGTTSINVPILALAGRDDRMTNPAALAQWQDYTSKRLAIEWIDGEHYFILDQPGRVALCIDEFDREVDAPALAARH